MLSGFIARKTVVSTSEESAAPTPTNPGPNPTQNRVELSLADIGARLGEDNEALRNLLIDTGRRVGALGDVKNAFRDLAEPIKAALRDLEQERIDNDGLRNALAELSAGYDTLHGEFSALEKRAAELESSREGDHQQLVQAQKTALGLETNNVELTSEIAAARARLQQMETSLATARAERAALSRALNEANERHQSETYALSLRLEALRSRAATAEKLLSEVRQSLVARTEELRISERKAAEATIARAAAEKTIEGLSAARDALDAKVKTLELGRASLVERSNSLAEALKMREASLTQAQQEIRSLTDRIGDIEVDAGAYRTKTERRIEELNENLQRERVAARSASDSKIRELEQARASLIERSNSLAESLKLRGSDLAQAERKIKSLTDRITEIEVDTRAYRDNIERRMEELNESLQCERVAARDALEETIRELEQGRASLIERSNSLAETLKAREASRADAERMIKSLTDRIAEIGAEAEAYRANSERRIEELNQNLQRERIAARGALDGKVSELEQERTSLIEQSDCLAGLLSARETELAHAEQKIKSLTDRIAEIERAAEASRAKTERRIEELNTAVQRERGEVAAARDVAAGKRPDFERDGVSLIGPSNSLAETLQARETDLARAEQIAVFVSRKESKILVREGLVSLFVIPVVIDEPDRPLGTHVFTAMGSTENGAGIRWRLVASPTDLSAPFDHRDKSKGISKPTAHASLSATEALNRIQWPKEAADRLIEFLIPGSSLVISDEGLGPITRSWCAWIKPTRGM